MKGQKNLFLMGAKLDEKVKESFPCGWGAGEGR
jgi:hypothetical protein